MTRTPTLPQQAQVASLRRIRMLLQKLAPPALWTVSLFAAAGTLNWFRGWLSLALYVVGMSSIGVFVRQSNPQLMEARTTWGAKGTKPFDRIFMAVLMPLVFIHPALAGVDVVRYRWSSMPIGVLYAGSVLFMFSIVLIAWALGTNRYAETTVRIQTDRNHTVADAGPYRILRHPMYTGAILMYLSTALVWGSVYALFLSLLISALFIWRTALEDRTLRQELDGYDEYMQRTCYRLVPGLW